MSFAIAKGTIYFLPLALAAMASARVYAGVELAYAVTLLVGTATISAPLHGLSHGFLVRKEREVAGLSALLVLGMAVFAVMATAIGWFAGASEELLLILAVSGVAGGQIVMSFVLRIHAKGALLAWVDGSVLLIGASLVALVNLMDGGTSINAVVAGYAIVALAAGIVSGRILLRCDVRAMAKRLIAYSRAGLPMAGFALFSTWMVVNGRVIIGAKSGADLAAFGVAFRIAGLTLAVSQLGVTAFWNAIYTSKTRIADGLIARFIVASALLAALIASCSGLVLEAMRFGALTAGSASLTRSLVPILCLQMLFIATHTLLQARINRSGVSSTTLIPLASLTVAGLIGIVVASRLGASTVTLAWLIAAYTGCFVAVSLLVLARRGLPHVRTATTLAVSACGLALLAVLKG
ncbi:MAG TPA: hypothetical protein VGB70_11235 [Allosphingosinicella sp.]|jgi:hypothetical protein